MKENLEINDNDENLNLSTNGKLYNGNFNKRFQTYKLKFKNTK